MGFSSDAGYVPVPISTLIDQVMANVNTQFGTSYTTDTFIGTNFYKFFYALIQRLQENEIKTSEIFLNLQQYFSITNEKILRPNTTAPGIIDYFAARGFGVSVKPPEDGDAGKVFICANVNGSAPNYAAIKLQICEIVRDCVVAGVVSQGDQVESLTLSNDQSFDFKFKLPNKIPVLLKLTTTLSVNNEFTILSPDDIKAKLKDNIDSRYGLGRDFEPQRYFSVIDAPWASVILLEWSDDAGANYHSTVFSANYDDLYTFGIGDISLVEM